jgi:phage terminase small subunit
MHRLQGTRASSSRLDEPHAPGNLDATPPAGLTPAQAELWRYHVENAPAGVLKPIDGRLLQTFVVALDLQAQAAALMASAGLLIETVRRASEHPSVRTFARMSALVVRLSSEMGFSPASRPRIQASPAQASLNLFEEFAVRSPAHKTH